MLLQRIYKTAFEMSHIIPNHPQCGINHGHSYNLIVKLDGDSDIWLDFHDIKDVVEKEIKEKYDHKIDPDTNKIYEISAEELAIRIGRYLNTKGLRGELELYETAKYGVRYEFGRILSPI